MYINLYLMVCYERPPLCNTVIWWPLADRVGQIVQMTKSHAFTILTRIESKTRTIRVLTPHVISPAETWEADREWKESKRRRRAKKRKEELAHRPNWCEKKQREGGKTSERLCWWLARGMRAALSAVAQEAASQSQKLSAAPPSKREGEKIFKSKKRQKTRKILNGNKKQWKGGKKKTKNQNLQTDKCNSSFFS